MLLPEIVTRISQYEMAFRMQMSVPELMDFRDESAHILDLYGTKGAAIANVLSVCDNPNNRLTCRSVTIQNSLQIVALDSLPATHPGRDF